MKEVKVEVKKFVTKYQSDDGKMLFDTQEQCIDYEERMNGNRKTCEKCHGNGYIVYGMRTEQDRYTNDFVTIDLKDTCPMCKGKDYLDKKNYLGVNNFICFYIFR